MPIRSRLVLAALLVALLPAATSPAAARPSAEETLRYRWKLDGFVGALASLFVPAGGEGVLSLSELPNGHLKSELLVTATERAKGDYFRYGSEWQPASGETVRAWSDLVWRGERKSKQADVDQKGVIDIVSGIQLLRRQTPTAARRMEIWSDGRLYPVLVLPRGTVRRRLEGREVAAQHLTVRGLKISGRKVWQGELELWIADDPAATPVEIAVVRKGARVRLSFVDRGVEPSPAPEKVGEKASPSDPNGEPPKRGGTP